MAAIHWLNDVSGDFNTGTNWSGGVVPSVSDDVTLGVLAGTPYTVTESRAGLQQVHTLQVAANVTFDIGVNSFQQSNFQSLYGGGNAGTIDVLAGDLLLGNLAFANSGSISLGSAGSGGQLILASSTLTGGGQIVLGSGFSSSIDLYGSSANVDNIISGGGFIGGGAAGATLANGAAGVIDANGVGGVGLYVSNDPITNNGLMESTTATGNGLDIRRGANVDQAGGGTILAANGALVFLEQVTISGGTLSSVGTGVFHIGFNNTVLDGSSSPLANKATVDVLGGYTTGQYEATLKGAIVNSGVINVDGARQTGNQTNLIIDAAGVTLTGAGSINLLPGVPSRVGAGPSTIVGASGGGSILTNVDNTIAGEGAIGQYALTLINKAKGVIDANAAGALIINTGSATSANAGLIEATGAGGLTIASAIVNTGTLLAAAGSVVTLTDGADILGGALGTVGSGVIQTNGSTITLDGSTSPVTVAANLGVSSGAILTLKGEVDLVAGTITGGTVTNTGTLGGYGAVAATIVNSGTLSAQAGHTLDLHAATLVNKAGAALAANAGATLQAPDDTTFGIFASTVILNGASSVVRSFDTKTSSQVTFEQGATGLSATGVLEVLGGRGYATTNAFANAGKLELGGGTFTSGVLTDAAGSTLTGFGAVASVFIDSGKVSATGGGLRFTASGDSFAGALGGTQIDFAGGADLLKSGSSLTASNIGLSGGAAVTLGANQAFAGTWNQGAATVNLGGFTLTLSGASTIAGAVNGSGTLAFTGGAQAVNAGAAIGAANWSITGGAATTLNEKLTYGGRLTVGAASSFTVGAGQTLSLKGGSLVNAGTIDLGGASLVVAANTTLSGGGTVNLGAGGTNRLYGASAATVLDNVDNTIVGAGLVGLGRLTLINEAKGVIDATGTMVLDTAGHTLVNAGLVAATGGARLALVSTTVDNRGGTLMAAAGSVINLEGATVIGGTLQSSGAGSAIQTSAGVNLIDGTTSTVVDQATLSISDGTVLTASGAIDNTGHILLRASSHAARLAVGTAGLTLSGGGQVILTDNAFNQILAVSGTPTLTNVDNRISGAGQLGAASLILVNGAKGVIEATGASKALILNTGSNTIANAGTLEAAGGMLIVDSAVSGFGSAVINGGTLDFASTFSQAVRFIGTGVLELAKSQSFTGAITGFSKTGGTSLDLRDIAFKTAGEATFSGTATSGLLTVTDGVHTARITLIGDYRTATFTAASDGNGGVTIVDPTAPPTPHAMIAAMAALVPNAAAIPYACAAPTGRTPTLVSTPGHSS